MAWIFDKGSPIGVNTTGKPIPGLGVASKDLKKWVAIAHVVWSEVTGLCGVWEGSCENGTRGAGLMIQIFTKAVGWVPIHKKWSRVRGRNSLDAELGGCSMLLEISGRWVDKSLCAP